MKKTLLFVVLMLLCSTVLIAGCAPAATAPASEAPASEAPVSEAPVSEAPASEAPAADGDAATGGKKIAFINPYVSAPYMAAYVTAQNAKADELGVELVMMDAEGNSQKAYDLAQSALGQNFDGIMLLSPDTKSSISIVKMIQKAGIPMIITNAKADDSVQKDLTFVGADLELQGEMAGEMALEVMGDDGGKVCVIEGPGGHDAAISRSAGFMKAIEGKDKVEVLGVQQADWDRALAMQKMEDFLTQFPEIDVVYCHDDNMAIGAVEAAKAAGRLDDIKIIGVGAAKDGLEAIKNGEMYGTVLQSPGEEGEKSLVAMLDTIDGKTLDKWIKLACDKITIENVNDYKGEW